MHPKHPFYGYQEFARRNAAADGGQFADQEQPAASPDNEYPAEASPEQASPVSEDENPLGSLFPPGVAGLVPPDMGDMADDAGQEEGQGTGEAVLSDVELALLCRERICPGCSVKQEADSERLRAVADLDNARKRLTREKEEQSRYAAEAVLADILPALDNLGLALQYAPKDGQSKNFVMGVDMTRNLLVEALKGHGLQTVGAVGDLFDPSLHEAVSMGNDQNIEDNHICSLLTSGYSLNGRLLRPAKVVVCKRN